MLQSRLVEGGREIFRETRSCTEALELMWYSGIFAFD